ncbi:NUDIX hydrolase domain-like protein [Lasiosphaeria hispida]|uniref:NUDIX hydrolase domain-like protein n=1 Tax=Lasiosphaeria hispida TaxID=260671 RepID=A0AAJ0HKD7_9PEZI|nr:NUDIX hydrolase domain-like protein [Lasiosphaeria hispida]
MNMNGAFAWPRVAVIAIIRDHQGRVCTGRRIGALGGGQLSFPGGHLELGEGIFACVEREALEESGLVIRGVQVIGVTNDFFVKNNKHYITIFAECEQLDLKQQPQRLEPEKCEGWGWMSWEELEALAKNESTSEELFLPVVNLIRSNLYKPSNIHQL